jgi:hypothetical protein
MAIAIAWLQNHWKPVFTRFIIAVLTVMGILIAESQWNFPFWDDNNTWKLFLIKFILLLLLYIIGELTQTFFSRFSKPFFNLVDLEGDVLKYNIHITSYNENSSESTLAEGDEIHIVADTLLDYDIPFVQSIANALENAADYFYYLPIRDLQNNDDLIQEAILFIEKLIETMQKKSTTNERIRAALSHLHIFNIGEQSRYCYNFSQSIFKNCQYADRIDTLCWYQSVHSRKKDTSDDKLFSAEMAASLSHRGISIDKEQLADITQNAQVIVRIKGDNSDCIHTIDKFKQSLKRLIKTRVITTGNEISIGTSEFPKAVDKSKDHFKHCLLMKNSG